ncbi:MAG: M20 family metallopeptidase [Trueperaceae bacterium]|nr:M20 family metallopeptidase [Trueperaceae bacterium]
MTNQTTEQRDDIEALARQAAAAVDAEQVVRLTRDLVRLRSVVEPERGGNEEPVADYLMVLLRGWGLEPLRQDAAPGRPNVICDWAGTGFDPDHHKTLMFEGHSDVVTEGDPDRWRYPPFEARQVDGRIYGRGSADMKAGVAAALAALSAVRATAPRLAGRVRLGIVADEEGLMIGIKHFIAAGWADAVDGAIVCEPEQNELCLFQKGAMRLHIRVTGVMSHGAMPYAGVNPLPVLAEIIGRIQQLEADEQQRCGEHPYLGLPWITPTIVRAPAHGEAQHNVVPETGYLGVDIRTVPGQDHDALLQAIDDIATEVASRDDRLSAEVECFESRPWTETPADDPLVGALEEAYPLVLDEAPKYGGVPGATDGTFLHSQAGVPIVTVGPGDRTIPHQRDEYVDIAEIVKSARLYAAATVLFLSTSKTT